MWTAQIGKYQFDVWSFGSAEWNANEISKFDIQVPAHQAFNKDLFTLPVYVYYDNHLVLRGLVQDSNDTQYRGGRYMTRINCLGEEGYLMVSYLPRYNAHYQNQLLTVAIQDILAATGGTWVMWDTSTLTSLSVSTTIDLRKEETIWAQLVKLVSATPSHFVRFRELMNGIFRLDVGTFETPIVATLHRGIYTKPLKFQRKETLPVYRAAAYGAESGGVVPTLGHALGFHPELTSDPDFRIIPNNLGGYYIQNMSLSKGEHRVYEFDVLKTKNDTAPTTAEVYQAGYAVYQKAVREMQISASSFHVTAECVLSFLPRIPSAFRVIGEVFDIAYNPLLDSAEELASIQIDEVLIAHKMKLLGIGYDEQGGLSYHVALELSSNGFPPKKDAGKALVEKIPTDKDRKDDSKQFLSSSVVSVNHSGVASDCTHSSGAAGKTFTFAMPAVPGGATGVYVSVIATNGSSLVLLTQPPALPATGAIACVTDADGGAWSVSSNVTCQATFYFVQ